MIMFASYLSFTSKYPKTLSAQPELCHIALKSRWDKWELLGSTQHTEAHSRRGKISPTLSGL